MQQFEMIYEENKKLDEIFDDLYDNENYDTFRKNALELLVELGELANETRCFKYWSNKKASEKEIVLDEFADCMLMILFFANKLDIKLDEEFKVINENDIILQFVNLYKEASLIIEDFNKERIKTILSNLVNLGHLIGFSDMDIKEGCIKKINRNKERFKTGF